jgi:hypothetical protein
MATVSVSASSRRNFVNIALFYLKTRDKMIFNSEDKILITSLYLFKGYNVTRLLAEFSDKTGKKQELKCCFVLLFIVKIVVNRR